MPASSPTLPHLWIFGDKEGYNMESNAGNRSGFKIKVGKRSKRETKCGEGSQSQNPKCCTASLQDSPNALPVSQEDESTMSMDYDDTTAPASSWSAQPVIRARDSGSSASSDADDDEDELDRKLKASVKYSFSNTDEARLWRLVNNDPPKAPIALYPSNEQRPEYFAKQPAYTTSTFPPGSRVLHRVSSMDVNVGGNNDCPLHEDEIAHLKGLVVKERQQKARLADNDAQLRKDKHEMATVIRNLQAENARLRSENWSEKATKSKYRNEVARREEKNIGRPLTDSERMKLIKLWEGADARI